MRYGFDPSDHDITEVIRKIQEGESEPQSVPRNTGREKVHIVRVGGRNMNPGDSAESIEVPVLYDSKLSCVVTAGDFLLSEDLEEWVWH